MAMCLRLLLATCSVKVLKPELLPGNLQWL